MFFFGKNNLFDKLGYNHYHKRMFDRYLREKEGWTIHNEKTKKFISDNLPSGIINSVAVLGSGWLIDVPIDFLLSRCNKIYLVDIKHPNQIKHKFRNNKKVVFIEKDLNGDLLQQLNSKMKFLNKTVKFPLNEILTNGFSDDGFSDADFLISVNLLSQLSHPITDFLSKYKLFTEEELSDLTKRNQQSHINCLMKKQSIIISDFEEKRIDKNGDCSVHPIVLAELPKGKTECQWEWLFDNTFNYYIDKNVIMRVIAKSYA